MNYLPETPPTYHKYDLRSYGWTQALLALDIIRLEIPNAHREYTSLADLVTDIAIENSNSMLPNATEPDRAQIFHGIRSFFKTVTFNKAQDRFNSRREDLPRVRRSIRSTPEGA